MPNRSVRAFRGATTVADDDEGLVRVATARMISELFERNGVANDDLISIFVTVTPDIRSMFAARAIREECALDDVPLMGAVEADITSGPDRCIRVMVHAHSDLARADAQAVYHGETARLRPDLDVPEAH